MFCNNCGNQIPDGTKFCANCGASQEVTQPVQPTQAATVQQQAVAPKKNNILLIAVVAAIAVVAIAAVAVFALSGKDNGGNSGGNDLPVTNNSQSEDVDEISEDTSSVIESTDDTTSTLTAIDCGYPTGKAFLSDLGEFGKVSLSVGYDKDNGVIRQVAASFTITVRHSEYASMKSDFEAWEERLSNLGDKNIEASYVELSESVSFIIGIKELNEADRATRVDIAEEILDFVADEEDYAFYIDDITTLLTETYGFEIQD